LATRFDYDAVFGTVHNRFIVQATCGYPLTVYGSGAQIRGMLDIRDTVKCIRLAAEHPAAPGEFRLFNQFTEQFSVSQIAEMIRAAYPGPVRIERIDNPRVEAAEHYYHAVHARLADLGLKPHLLNDTLIESLFVIAKRHQGRADPRLFAPSVQWSATSSPVGPDAIGAPAVA
jgi:UDP-sulfoquinovose synthase